MYQPFLTFIRENSLLERENTVLCAVSGGVDSMVMLSLLQEAGYKLAVAHVNYGLRGAESDADTELVTGWCEERKITLHKHQVTAETYQSGQSIQMIARQIRYDFFERLVTEHGYDKVATAHNANDSLETVLLNMIKGTGIFGLTGIAVTRGNIIRPLLFATKEDIYEYAKTAGIPWREDKSNAKNDYQRNLIRNEIVPLMKQINPNLEGTFQQTIQRLQGSAAMLKEKLDGIHPMDHTSGVKEFDLTWFKPDAEHTTLLSELIKPFGFHFSETLDLVHAIKEGMSGKLFYSRTHLINFDRNKLLVSNLSDDHEVDLLISENEPNLEYRNWSLTFTRMAGNVFDKNTPAQVAFLDVDLVQFPLRIRNWHQGDHFQPLGMTGKKKVSDFMIDAKIPVTLKQDVLVLESAGEIIWLVQHRVDDRFKITSKTRMMLKIEFSEHA